MRKVAEKLLLAQLKKHALLAGQAAAAPAVVEAAAAEVHEALRPFGDLTGPEETEDALLAARLQAYGDRHAGGAVRY